MKKEKKNTVQSRGPRKLSPKKKAVDLSPRKSKTLLNDNLATHSAPKFDNPYAALSATNEAILHAKSPAELYQGVCDTAVFDNKFLMTLIAIAEPGKPWANVVAATGPGQDFIRKVGISLDETRPEGRGLVGMAFRTKKPCVTNDYLNDPRLKPWRKLATDFGYRAGAALPIIVSGRCSGVIFFCANEKGVFDDERLLLLERMVANIAYAIDNLDREAERRAAEQALRESEERFRSLTGLSSDWYWEQDAEFRFTRLEGQLAASDEILGNAANGKCFWEIGLEDESGGQSYRPLLEAHRPIQDLVLCLVLSGGTTRYFRINGQPVVDAGGQFAGYRGMGREITEQKRADRSALRLGQMYAALNATIEVVLHAKTPEELYKGVCDAAVHGSRFRGTVIFIHEPGQLWVKPMAFTGPQGLAPSKAQISVDENLPEGQGLVGNAFRAQKPFISNDFRSDERSRPWRQLIIDAGISSAAAFPLVQRGRSIGVLIFYGAEVGEFDDEMVDMLERLLANVSFALEKFQQEAELRESEERFRSLVTISSDWYWEQDAEFRFTRLEGQHASSDEILGSAAIGKCVWEIGLEDESGGQSYRPLFEAHQPVQDSVLCLVSSGGTTRYFRINGQPVVDTGGQFAGYRGMGREITEQKHAERSALRLGKMYAALNATIEVVLHAKTPEELYKGVCEAAVQGSGFRGTVIFRHEPGQLWVKPMAYSGPQGLTPASTQISVDENLPQGQGLVGNAFRTQKPFISNDFRSDERSRPWRQLIIDAGISSAAAFPLIQRGQSIGVLIFYGAEVGEFNDAMVELLERLLANVSFALEKFQQEAELRESEERFRGLTGLSSDWYWEQDAEFRFTRLEGQHVAGGESLSEDSSIGKCRWETGLDIDGGWDAHRALLQNCHPFRDVEMYRVLLDGTRQYIGVSGEPIFDRDCAFAGYRGVGKDITARRLSEERIQYMATHDVLTGLPNRLMFSQLLNHAIQGAQRYQRLFAVFFIDLDRFKNINDTMGHEAGDQLLQEIAARLKQTLRAVDVVARLGGDEFVILIEEFNDLSQVEIVAGKILSNVIKPVNIMNEECRVTASIGISVFPKDAKDEQSLMKNADIAMYQAKEEGKNNYQFYSEDIQAKSLERQSIETNLRFALERNELSLHYQAQVDFKTNVIKGVEALLRWQNPYLGTVTPTQFIPVAEESGLIIPIGKWVLRTACAQNVAWQRAGLPPVCIAVNLSLRQLMDEFLVEDIKKALDDSGMAPNLLELEITESMVMHNPSRMIAVLTKIKNLGVRLAIDDFGTGYSSLAQIKHFPIDTLKVDRSFIRNIPQDSEDKAITEAIISMGRTLSLTVVAEGVETIEQMDFLKDHSCDEMQGYYFSKPIAPEQFAELLRENVPSM